MPTSIGDPVGFTEGLGVVALARGLDVGEARFALGIDGPADVIRATARVERIRSEAATPPFSQDETGGDVIARVGSRFAALMRV
jgi:hypothetical protein